MRTRVLSVVSSLLAMLALVGGVATAPAHAAVVTPALAAPLHTTGSDSTIYDSAGRPVRLIGFNWSGMESGGRADLLKAPDATGAIWSTPADGINGITYENMFQVLRDWGYNVVRLPFVWQNLEPVAPRWSAALNRYVHTWNPNYVNDMKAIVSQARAAGLSVILDMHQDYWSPALHNITNWNGTRGMAEGDGMPRWLNPSIDVKASTTQNTDFYNGMNWFYRNVRDPASTLTHATPWQLFYNAWDYVAYVFSPLSGYPDYSAVIGADILNEPYFSYVGGSPPAGQTVLQAAGSRLRSFYNALAPAVTNRHPEWLLIFEDSTGGYYSANPALRESPAMTGRPTVAGQWVYSAHIYNFVYGTFRDGVPRHDDFGITVAEAFRANAVAWKVPLYIGEFTNFTLGIDARRLTTTDMVQTRAFLAWAKTNNVSWTFWCYVNGYTPMTVIDYTNNQAIAVVRDTLATGR